MNEFLSFKHNMTLTFKLSFTSLFKSDPGVYGFIKVQILKL